MIINRLFVYKECNIDQLFKDGLVYLKSKRQKKIPNIYLVIVNMVFERSNDG